MVIPPTPVWESSVSSMVKKPVKDMLKKTLERTPFQLDERLEKMKGKWEFVSEKGKRYVGKRVEGEVKHAVPWSDYLKFKKSQGTIERLVYKNTKKYGRRKAIEMALSSVGLPLSLAPFITDFMDV
jgi:Txe/YoeB family toxin of Txe-Axe toxin-antitoxin module